MTCNSDIGYKLEYKICSMESNSLKPIVDYPLFAITRTQVWAHNTQAKKRKIAKQDIFKCQLIIYTSSGVLYFFYSVYSVKFGS